MIEIVIGLLVGATVGLVGATVDMLLGGALAASGRAENRALHTALRHIRGELVNSGVLPSVARHIDRVLDGHAP